MLDTTSGTGESMVNRDIHGQWVLILAKQESISSETGRRAVKKNKEYHKCTWKMLERDLA